MSLVYSTLKTLSDGCFHSGEDLAQSAGVTRAAIWKAIQALQSDYDLDIHSVRGRGYRLAQSIELLDRSTILKFLQTKAKLNGLETFLSIESTNQYLLHNDTDVVHAPWVVLAERQSAGRGRRGRAWLSPFAGNIYFSMLWRFNQVNANFIGLSLVVGVAVCRLLAHLGVEQLGLKWPNDVLCQGKKLCGILIEMRGETNGPYDAVIGIGLNLTMPEAVGRLIDQPWITLQQVSATMPARNRLAAQLTDVMLETMPEFEAHGLHPFLEEWKRLDLFRDQHVTLQLGDNEIQGIERGVDEQGALLIEYNGKLQRFYSGEISLRMQ
jgi:BirA family biotin operon repressor/biotin-[acetyl-CoA-carboxylase] ligase